MAMRDINQIRAANDAHAAAFRAMQQRMEVAVAAECAAHGLPYEVYAEIATEMRGLLAGDVTEART